MPTQKISFADTGYFSSLIIDYLAQDEKVQDLYNRFPSIASVPDQIAEKQAYFNSDKRAVLANVLQEQYRDLDNSELAKEKIELLLKDQTFTVVTGHQLNLFTGPLYFVYKIVSTINMCRKLKERYPQYHFVPTYWMATEDHDFEEISFFNLRGKKLHWFRNANGAVGRLSTEGLEDIATLLKKELGQTTNAKQLVAWFERAYLEHQSLTEATRYLVHQLFGSYGLLIVDGDHPSLKQLFVPHVRNELLTGFSEQSVGATNNKLKEKGYPIQVNPRPINLFYLRGDRRDRILKTEKGFQINQTNMVFSSEEILEELQQYPDRFSPNVLLRPLYQEVVLPNLCYIGGGGELAYWLQLKQVFQTAAVPFPMLMLRNSVLLVSEKLHKKIEKLQLNYKNLFLHRHNFINQKIREISNVDINFLKYRQVLEKQFIQMYELAKLTDKSFLGAVKAQERKQLKGLDNLEKRLLKAQRIKLKDQVMRMSNIQQQLFPNDSLQERNTNFSEWYMQYGEEWIPALLDELDPFDARFLIYIL